MSTLNGQELEIFRAGDYGAKGVYTPADLQQLASDYDPAQHEAPLVLGHPKTEDRAYGWCKSLRAAGDTLFATFQQVPAAIDRMVNDGAYKKRSVALTRKSDGKLTLRHVGLLGAMVPAIAGMPDAKFSNETFEEFEFNDAPKGDGMPDQQVDKKTIRETITEVFADLFGGNKGKGADSAVLREMEERITSKFDADLKTERDARATSERQFADYRATHEKQGRSTAAKDAIASLKAKGQWLPALNGKGVEELFSAVAEGSTQEFEFADTGGTKKKIAPLAVLSALVAFASKAVPRDVIFSDEVATANTPTAPVAKADGAPVSAKTDPASEAFDRDVRARMAKDSVDYRVAANRLYAEGKSSESYAGATSGAV